MLIQHPSADDGFLLLALIAAEEDIRLMQLRPNAICWRWLPAALELFMRRRQHRRSDLRLEC